MSQKNLLVAIVPLLWVTNANAWTPGTYPAPSRGLAVDIQSRNDVLAFWHGVYRESDDFESHMGWTGSYGTGASAQGTNSAEFVADTERRLNFYRAMAGVPANATINTASPVVIRTADTYKPPAATTKAQAVQRAALMLTMNYNVSTGTNPAYSHNPPVTATWDAIPWNAMKNGNISQGFHGPNAISAYISENVDNGAGQENFLAGHRRWMLRPSATNFASGDIPGYYNSQVGNSSLRRPSNVIYVTQSEAETATVTPGFTPYPPAGFFPAPLNAKFWSLSYPGANFSAATVSVSVVGGGTVAAVKRTVGSGYGDPTIVWEMPAAHAATSFSFDTTYSVTVSGITGSGVPTSHSYQVTLVNPEILTSDQTLTGTEYPNPNYPATYELTPPPFAEGLRVNIYRQIPSTWTEDAEPSTPTTFTANTAASYPILFSPVSGDPGFTAITGSRSFRLTHPVFYDPTLNGVPQQSFEIGKKILPNVGAALTFRYKRGYMTTASRLAVEMTANGGATWAVLGEISGNNSNSVDSSATNVSYPLPASSSPLSFRFRYYNTPGSIYTHEQYPTYATGILIDNIAVSNCDYLEPRMTNNLSAASTHFILDSTTRGGSMLVGEKWQLALQTKLGNRWFAEGPLKPIVASAIIPLTPYEQWVSGYPGLTGDFYGDHDGDGIPNGVEFAFSTEPMEKTADTTVVIANSGDPNVSIRSQLPAVREGITYAAECCDDLASWTAEDVVINISGGFITATAPRFPSGRCYIRWRITMP